MYKNKKILCFIPARKGSKRVPFKNGKLLNGKPLFQYSVDVAQKSFYIDDIIVSTDSEEILEQAHRMGCIKNKLRPDSLSDDKVFYLNSDGFVNNGGADNLHTIRPVFYLKSSAGYAGGNGTKNSPFRLS